MYDLDDVVSNGFDEVIWYCKENDIDVSDISVDSLGRRIVGIIDEYLEDGYDGDMDELVDFVIGDLSLVDLYEMSLK